LGSGKGNYGTLLGWRGIDNVKERQCRAKACRHIPEIFVFRGGFERAKQFRSPLSPGTASMTCVYQAACRLIQGGFNVGVGKRLQTFAKRLLGLFRTKKRSPEWELRFKV